MSGLNNWLFDGLFSENAIDDETRLNKTFLQQPDRSKISYQQLHQSISTFANTLIGLGLKPNNTVAVQVDKSIDALVMYLATVKAGGIFLPLNTAYVASEIEYFITDAMPTIFICSSENEASLSKLLKNMDVQLFTMDDNGVGSWYQQTKHYSDSFDAIARNENDLAAILYTSGTTGRSKGAMLTHGNLLSNAQTLAEYWEYSESDVLLHALPVYHTHGLFVAVNITLISHASLIYLKQFKANIVCDQLPHCTVMMGVPTFYTRLLSSDRFDKSTCENMRLFISGSAPLLAEDHQRFEEKSGHMILERYGMTETNMNTSNPCKITEQLGRKAGSVGFALPGVAVRITDTDSGDLVENGKTGMIEVKGANVFKGYWNMPEKTAEEFTDDGYFKTGDLGVRDNDGYISIVGREKDLIISGGLNIYPKDVELVINQCNSVLESAVIGVADADFGERVVAIIVLKKSVLKESAGNRDDVKQQINRHLNEKLASFKRPKDLYFVTELPRNAMGKVQKNNLRETYS